MPQYERIAGGFQLNTPKRDKPDILTKPRCHIGLLKIGLVIRLA
jgi:hypothetical protein